jgi:hypothetical protein
VRFGFSDEGRRQRGRISIVDGRTTALEEVPIMPDRVLRMNWSHIPTPHMPQWHALVRQAFRTVALSAPPSVDSGAIWAASYDVRLPSLTVSLRAFQSNE